MRAPVPLPAEPPFLSFYTPTFRRPSGLSACLASVGKQTLRDRIEQIVIPDHSCFGLAAGLYGRIPWYAEAFRGEYVSILCDDDVLAADTVVERLSAFVDERDRPEVVVMRVIKNGVHLPTMNPTREPVAGTLDLASYVLRRDVWLAHAHDYGDRYEGDFDHAAAMYRAGRKVAFLDQLWVVGGANHGRPELDY